MLSLYNRGNTPVVLLATAVVVSVVGFVGYNVVHDKSEPSTTTSSQSAPASINTIDDITAADATLNAAELESEVDTTQLDSDIDALL